METLRELWKYCSPPVGREVCIPTESTDSMLVVVVGGVGGPFFYFYYYYTSKE